MQKYFVIFFFFLIGALFTSQRVYAQSAADIMWQHSVPKNITATADLQALLEREVQNVVNAGHIAPFRTMYGEQDAQYRVHYYWYQPYDTVYTLSLAYPYLSSSLQQKVKTYLASEMQSYPVWSGSLLPINTGTLREPDILKTSDRPDYIAAYKDRPKLFGLYALWLYANNTGNWQYIEQNWNSISSFYNARSSEVSKYYSSMAGAIGMLRMAQQKPTPDTAMVSSVTAQLQSGFAAGKNFSQMGQNADSVYLNGFIGGPEWVREAVTRTFQFYDLSPEIVRYFGSDTALSQSVIGTNSDMYSIRRAESRFPLWFMSQAPEFARYTGEDSGLTPDHKMMLFPLHAYLLKDTPEKLRYYLDVRDALLGDYYYMQNLARTIESHGQRCWVDVRNTSSSICETAPVVPTDNPQPTPTNTPVCKGDINRDTRVNLADYQILTGNFLRSQLSDTRADLTGEGAVNLSDFNLFVTLYLRSCTY